MGTAITTVVTGKLVSFRGDEDEDEYYAIQRDNRMYSNLPNLNDLLEPLKDRLVEFTFVTTGKGEFAIHIKAKEVDTK